MPTRELRERKRIEETKLNELKQAANQGWADVLAGRFTDVADDRLDAFIGQLGRTASAIEGRRHETREID